MANNRIQIKRSVANATVTGLSNGELAFTQASNTLHIGLPDGSGVLRIGGAQYPGTLTNNHALVANSTGAIDKVIAANAVISTLWANGSAGGNGQVLVSDGSTVYWGTGTSGANTQIQFNDSGVANASAGFTFDKSSNSLFVANTIYTTTVNAASFKVGSSFVANSTTLLLGTTVGINANGSIGTAGQVLHSNGTTVYWRDPALDLITEVVAGDGLNGGGTEGILTLDVGAGFGIAVNATSTFVLANNGIIANTTGTWVKPSNGVFVDSSGVGVNANNGIVSNTSGTWAKAANGISVDSSGINVVAGTGVHVNSTAVYIGQPVETTSNVTFANVVTTDLTVNGNTVIGSNTADSVTVTAQVSSNLMPSANATYHIGNNTLRWAQVHTANLHAVTGTFDGNVQIDGNLIVSGNVTTVNVNSVIVSDPMIYLAGNNYSSDLVDIGIAANYHDISSNTNYHTGLFRDHHDGVWKLFYNLTQELSGNNDIDVSDASYRVATLNTFLDSGGLQTSNVSVSITANSTVNVAIVANTLTLSTALAGTEGGTGYKTTTDQAILVGNTSNGYSQLTLGTSGYVLQSNGSALLYDYLDGGSF